MRRRRTKYQWFGPLGLVGPAADDTDSTNGRAGSLQVPNNGTTNSTVVPVLPDFQAEDVGVSGPMGYLQNNDYVIKRIVGKLFLSLSQLSASDTIPAALVGAGLFVARAAESDVAPDIPIGATSAGLVTAEYGPLRDENAAQPWIWRRVWVLGQQGYTGSANVNTFPQNNANYGSIQDGPHIDAKTARHVNKEERLWFVISARSYPVTTAVVGNVQTVQWHFDGRFLGRMAKARNRGVF